MSTMCNLCPKYGSNTGTKSGATNEGGEGTLQQFRFSSFNCGL